MTNGIPALSIPAAMSCLRSFSLLFIQDVPLFLDLESRIHTGRAAKLESAPKKCAEPLDGLIQWPIMKMSVLLLHRQMSKCLIDVPGLQDEWRPI